VNEKTSQKQLKKEKQNILTTTTTATSTATVTSATLVQSCDIVATNVAVGAIIILR